MLGQYIIAELQMQYPNMDIKYYENSQPFAVISSIHKSWAIKTLLTFKKMQSDKINQDNTEYKAGYKVARNILFKAQPN